MKMFANLTMNGYEFALLKSLIRLHSLFHAAK
jgi:hypothetical protein